MSYNVLITDQNGALASAIAHGLDQSTFLKLIPPVAEGFNWLQTENIEAFFSESQPDLIINTLGWSDDGRDLAEDKNRPALEALVSVCETNKLPVLQLSSYRVFDGSKSGFVESDATKPRDGCGEFHFSLEQAVSILDRHIILRLSWVVGALGRNLLTNLLLPITAESEGYINAERRGSPVGHSDVARVINAIVKQVASGSANWGIFHYSSGDVCTEEEFAQELLARLEEKSIETGPIVDASGGHSEPLSAALGYRRLMDCFGIQPRTWRQGLKIELDRWLKECSTISKSVSKQSS